MAISYLKADLLMQFNYAFPEIESDYTTHQEIIDWFRDEHMIDVTAHREFPGKNSWVAVVVAVVVLNIPGAVYTSKLIEYPCRDRYDVVGGTYYEAIETAIRIAIETLKNRKS